MMIKPIHGDAFLHDGRGPELKETHWILRGATLAGVDYFNPADDYTVDPIRHVRFVKPQVVMITPEEVIGNEQLGAAFFEFRPAAMFDLGRSEWLQSFLPRHLDDCRHFKLLFYDELFDVICEGVECGLGSFSG